MSSSSAGTHSLLAQSDRAAMPPPPLLQEVERTLLQGEPFTEGGYIEKDVWGRMIAVIPAPPRIVWDVYIEADLWMRYNFPALIGSRLLDVEIALRMQQEKRGDKVYTILGEKVVDLNDYRRRREIWSDYHFQYYDVPWPVANRWMVIRNTCDETRWQEGIYHVTWTKAAGNVKTVDGYIHLRPSTSNPNRTLFEYYVRSNPDAFVPKFLIRWGAERALPKVYRSLKEESVRRLAREKLGGSTGSTH